MLPRYLILDVDDTLTLHGKLHGEVLSALERAAAAGIQVMLNTGRSAGWGAALHSYLPGVTAVLVENGGAWFDGLTGAAHAEVYPAFLDPGADPAAVRARLSAVREEAARRVGLALPPTADDAFRLTDHTAVRTVPGGAEGAVLIDRLRRAVAEISGGQAGLLASSVHLHFHLGARSKAAGVAALLSRRGVSDPDSELSRSAVAVGDSGNDASLFLPGRFALSVGVRNIERYLPELGACAPRHVTRAAEGQGVVELIDDLLSGRLELP